MGNHTQVDETYFGGKAANRHASQKDGVRGTASKVAVMGIRDERGHVRAEPVANTKRATVHSFIAENAPKGGTVVTDQFAAYLGLKGMGYNHVRINHAAGEFVKDMAHTNGIESFWSLLKRGYVGVYHYMSAKHLHRYVNEFSFRHNTSQVGTMAFINMTIDRMDSKRLTYKELTNG